MTFANIPPGAPIFVDANTLVYHFIADPLLGGPCTVLLDRIEHQDFPGVTSAQVLSELAHRLMTLEAQQRFAWPATGIAHRLKRHPNEIQQLSWHKRGIDEVRGVGIQVLPVEGTEVSLAADVAAQHGLLSNDALIVVVMRRYGISHLASHDADFDRCLESRVIPRSDRSDRKGGKEAYSSLNALDLIFKNGLIIGSRNR